MKSPIPTAIDARQTPGWGKYMKGIGWDVERVGKTQIFIRKMPLIGAVVKVQHPFGPFNLKKIDALAQKYGAAWTLIEPHGHGLDTEDLKKHGYEPSHFMLSHTSTMKIDLTRSEKALFASFSENARRNIRKAEKNGLKVKIVHMKDPKNWHYFETFYSLLRNLSKMKKFYVPSHAEYVKKMTAFKDTSYLFLAYEGETPICVVWYATFDDVVAYFQTGITTRGYETLANYLLVWEGLKFFRKLKLKVFDFESIYDERFPKHLKEKQHYTGFKKRFHGEIVLYPQPWIKTYTLRGRILYLCGKYL